MALKATATTTTRQAIIKIFGIVKPAIFSVSPNKENIKYIVRANHGALKETISDLVEELQTKRASIDQTIKFCRSYNQGSRIRKYIVRNLFGKGSKRCIMGPAKRFLVVYFHRLYTSYRKECHSGVIFRDKQCTQSCGGKLPLEWALIVQTSGRSFTGLSI